MQSTRFPARFNASWLTVLLACAGAQAIAESNAAPGAGLAEQTAVEAPVETTDAMSTPAVEDDAAAPAKALDTVVVEGAMPGPGLWEVRKGEHSLWVLGRITPLPKKLDWRAEEVQRVLDQAGVLLVAPSVTVTSNLGFWGSLALAPKAIGARKDPEKASLQEQLPAEAYARWLKLKQRYMPRSRAVEKWRPIFAAERLVKSAIRKSRLTQDRWVDEQVEKWAKKRDVPIVGPTAKLVIEDPKQMLNEFRAGRLDDLDCFETTLDWLERDLDLMRQRANAWAIGDIAMLGELAGENPRSACVETLLGSDLFKKRGFEDLPKRQRDAWLEAVDSALTEHPTSLAILPLESMIGDGEYLDALRARGYEVIAPE